MNQAVKKLQDSPLLVRAAPFILFLTLTMCQGQFGEASRYWFYFAKTLVGIPLLIVMWPAVQEMRWAFSWEAVVVGVGVCVMWVGIDGYYPSLDQMIQRFLCPLQKAIHLEGLCPKPAVLEADWNPHLQFGQNSTLAWLLIVTRLLGSSIIVPPLEEVFFRSFLYRYIIDPDFTKIPLALFNALSFGLTAFIFGFSHHEWLAGILCAFAYQGLVLRKKRLGDAMTAHAITNFLLGVWVVTRGAWNFW